MDSIEVKCTRRSNSKYSDDIYEKDLDNIEEEQMFLKLSPNFKVQDQSSSTSQISVNSSLDGLHDNSQNYNLSLSINELNSSVSDASTEKNFSMASKQSDINALESGSVPNTVLAETIAAAVENILVMLKFKFDFFDVYKLNNLQFF